MIDFKTNYLKTLVRELCETKDGDQILLDVFYVILDHYKKEELLESNSHLQRHIQFLEKTRNIKEPKYRQTQMGTIGKVAPYLYKIKKNKNENSTK